MRMTPSRAQHPVFKIAMLDRWLVVVSGAQMNEELRKIPDDQASFDDAAEEVPPLFSPPLAAAHRVLTSPSQAGAAEAHDRPRGVRAPRPCGRN